MSNYFEYNDKIVFHPGYYVKEIIEDSGVTQEDFAKRLDTTPKNLSLLVRGEQSLSIDMAIKLSRMLGTSIAYWLNLQNLYDTLYAESISENTLVREKEILAILDYRYFISNFGLPKHTGKINDRVVSLRQFLNVSSLTVLENNRLAVSFRTESTGVSDEDRIKANAMVQIATNKAISEKTCKFNKKKFNEAVNSILGLTREHEVFFGIAKKSFADAGVKLVAIPNISDSRINGATKKIGDSIMLMVNDRGSYGDSFWFTMFHEIGHIMNSDYGISLEFDDGIKESIADEYARNKLIPRDKYIEFVSKEDYSSRKIRKFANDIERDPGIVVGRLIHDGIVDAGNKEVNALRKKYKIYVYAH